MTFTTAAAHKLWISLTSPPHAVTHSMAAEVGLCMHKHNLGLFLCLPPFIYSSLPPSSLPPFLPSFRLTFSHPPPFPTVAPFSPIKEEQLYNNSRHDSQTLTLHIMELEVLGKPLMWESQVWTLSASLRNMMVLKPNKVCWWWWKVRNLPPEYRADKSVWTTVGMGATREEIN